MNKETHSVIQRFFNKCVYPITGPWRTSSVKPPNPATASSVELVLSRSIFPPRLQWNWSPHSFCHTLTTAILSFLGRLLPLSNAFVPHRTVLLTSYWKKRKTDDITPLFQFLHWLPIQQRIQYKIKTLCYKCITGTAPSFLCDRLQLYTPSRTLRSASDTLSLQIPRTRLFTVGSASFLFLVHQHGMTFPYLSDRNPLWTHSNLI